MNPYSDLIKNDKAETSGRSKRNMNFNVIQTMHCTEICKDGALWKVENTLNTSGRRPLQNILLENSEPTSRAKRYIYSDNPISAQRLIKEK